MCVAPPLFLAAREVALAFHSLMSVLAMVSPVSAVLPSVSSTKIPSGISWLAVDCFKGIAICHQFVAK